MHVVEKQPELAAGIHVPDAVAGDVAEGEAAAAVGGESPSGLCAGGAGSREQCQRSVQQCSSAESHVSLCRKDACDAGLLTACAHQPL